MALREETTINHNQIDHILVSKHLQNRVHMELILTEKVKTFKRVSKTEVLSDSV